MPKKPTAEDAQIIMKLYDLRREAEMRKALSAFNGSLPQEKVRILDRGGGWISLSPLEPQEEPRNLGKLKGEIGRRWPMTSLLDILKEAGRA